MGLELERNCPECDSSEFWRTASTTLHLGEKVKWDCTECDYGFVEFNDAADVGTA